MALEYFPCFFSYRKRIARLTNEEKGRLFDCLLEYAETGVKPEIEGRESIAFDFIAEDIDRGKEAYQQKCDKNRENAQNRWGSQKADASEGMRPYANVSEPMPTDAKHAKENQNQNQKQKPRKGYIDGRFTAFWDAYPKHVKKQDAEKAWLRLNPSEELTQTIINHVLKMRASPDWQKEQGKYIPYPASYLNGKRWEDEEFEPMDAFRQAMFLMEEEDGQKSNFEDDICHFDSLPKAKWI